MSYYRDEFTRTEREFYWSVPRIVVALVIGVTVLYGLGFVITGGDLAIYSFWAPKYENARRNVFVNTDSFVEGKIGSLTQERLAYETAEPGSSQQKALRTVILSEAAQIDNRKLPYDLQQFVNSLKGQF